MNLIFYFAIALSSTTYAWNTWGSNCCDLLLQSSFSDLISTPNSTQYENVTASYWSLQESSLSPYCIASPKQTSDVSGIISILTNGGRSVQQCPFAIKGGTHAPAAGFANIENGITIDMSLLNNIAYIQDSNIVGIGSGLSWLDVYKFLNKTSRAVPGGRNGQVGVGGLLLGGGISHFTTRVGFACDNVQNFEVVLATGEIINTNATSHPDLFQALKGGATNFGVVTRFDMETFPQGPLSVTSLVSNINQRDALFAGFSDITNSKPFDEDISLVMALLFNGTSKQWLASTSAVYTNASKQEAAFDQLKAVPNISNSTKIEWLANYANEAATPPLNWQFWTGTYAMSASLMSDVFDILNKTFYESPSAKGVTWSIAFEPLPTLIAEKSKQKGPNAFNDDLSNDNAFIMLISPLWPDATQNEAVMALTRQAGKNINDLARSQGMLHKFQYLNYADSTQSPIKHYGNASVAQLEAVSKKYDPYGVFQKQVPGGFKLPVS